MKSIIVKRKVISWLSYFISSSGEIHKFTFSDKKIAESVMCMFLAARKCSWIEKEEKYIWININAD